MMMNGHFKDELQDLLSGQLDPALRSEVENHLKSCAQCRQEFERLQLVKQVVATDLQTFQVPSDFHANISKVLDQKTPVSRKQSTWKKLLPYAAVFILILAGLLYFFTRRADLPSQVAADFRQFQEGDLSLQLQTNDVKRLEQFYTDQEMPFHVTVYDLAMMNYELMGGSIQNVNDRKAALYVYRGANGEYVICDMYLGSPSELPTGAEIRKDKGRTFYVYKRNGFTTVFWLDGGKVMCVLTSDIDPEQILQIAFAKASPVEGS